MRLELRRDGVGCVGAHINQTGTPWTELASPAWGSVRGTEWCWFGGDHTIQRGVGMYQ